MRDGDRNPVPMSGKFMPAMTKLRRGPNCASAGWPGTRWQT